MRRIFSDTRYSITQWAETFKSVRSVCSLSWDSNNKSYHCYIWIHLIRIYWMENLPWQCFHSSQPHLQICPKCQDCTHHHKHVIFSQNASKLVAPTTPEKIASLSRVESWLVLLSHSSTGVVTPVYYEVSQLSFSRVLALLPFTSPQWIMLSALYLQHCDMELWNWFSEKYLIRSKLF